MIDRREFLSLSVAACVGQLPMVAGEARAQAVTRFLVGFPAGGSIDVVARIVADRLRADGKSLVVENRAGAGGRLALDALKADETGGAVFVVTPGDQITLFPHIYKQLNYDPLRDFIPVTTLCSFPFVLAIGPMVPNDVTTLKDFLAWCRANANRASYGSAGTGTRPHFLGAALARLSGVEMTHIPFGGGAPALQAVLGSQIPAAVSVLANVLPHIQSGAIRPLLVTSPSRHASIPQVPTAAESGYPRIEALEWFGLFASRKAQDIEVRKLAAAVKDALETNDVRTRLGALAFEVSGVAGREFEDLIRADTERWGSIVGETGFSRID